MPFLLFAGDTAFAAFAASHVVIGVINRAANAIPSAVLVALTKIKPKSATDKSSNLPIPSTFAASGFFPPSRRLPRRWGHACEKRGDERFGV